MDSAPDICAAQMAVLAANGRGDVSEALLRCYIGRHLIDLFQDLGFPSEAIDPLIQSYRTTYWDRKHAATRVYPGVAEMLDLLGGRKSTATIKTTRTTRSVLERIHKSASWWAIRRRTWKPAAAPVFGHAQCDGATAITRRWPGGIRITGSTRPNNY